MNADGDVFTAGRFSVDADGKPSPAVFQIDGAITESPVSYILTIEPVENDPPHLQRYIFWRVISLQAQQVWTLSIKLPSAHHLVPLMARY